jgi:putative resolvase
MNDSKKYMPIREASTVSGIKPQTLRTLADNQTILCYKTPAGQRMFNRSSLEAMCNPILSSQEISPNTKTNFVYTRVSSKKQMDDLARQVEYIKNKRTDTITYTFISDIASGINFKRKGLETLLDACLQGTIGEVIIAHRDRLCRFGFDLIKHLVEKS